MLDLRGRIFCVMGLVGEEGVM